MSGEEAKKRPEAGTPVICRGTMPGVPQGTPAIVRHQSPSGHSNGLIWLELDDYIYWSHGRSESKGYWAGTGEFSLACWCPNRSAGRRHEFMAGRGVGLCGTEPRLTPVERGDRP